jgi:hypothetical protein
MAFKKLNDSGKMILKIPNVRLLVLAISMSKTYFIVNFRSKVNSEKKMTTSFIPTSYESKLGIDGKLIQRATTLYFTKIFKFRCILGQTS